MLISQPTDNGVIKFAIHQKGYLNPVGKLPSVPRTALSPGYENQNVPADAVAALKAGLGRVYPELATKQWLGSRICW
jgi:sarcosine oxidase/L-pipecolate oxidase